MTPSVRWLLIGLAGLGLIAAIGAAITGLVLAVQFAFNVTRFDSGPAPTVIIGIDLSTESPVISDDIFARRAAERVSTVIEDLGPRSTIKVRGFGDYGTDTDEIRFDWVISLRQNADSVARRVRILISRLPEAVRRETVEAHEQSNILAFLQDTVGMGMEGICQGGKSRIFLLTDGLEDSDYADLSAPDADLPMPDSPVLEGCAELHMIGVGHDQTSARFVDRIKALWREWADRAGVLRFRAYANL